MVVVRISFSDVSLCFLIYLGPGRADLSGFSEAKPAVYIEPPCGDIDTNATDVEESRGVTFHLWSVPSHPTGHWSVLSRCPSSVPHCMHPRNALK